jgi:hypothetical protein
LLAFAFSFALVFLIAFSFCRKTRISKNYRDVALAPIIGHPWGSFFQIIEGQLVRVEQSFTDQLLVCSRKARWE